MRRLTGTLLFSLVFVGLLSGQDVIYYTDPTTKKEANVTAVIEQEGPAGVKIKQGKETRLISSLDILQINYKQTKVDALTFRAPSGKLTNALKKTKPAERVTDLLDALKAFQDLAPQLREAPNIYRYLQFKIAEVKYHLAQDEPTHVAGAVEALRTFAKENPAGWEVVPALKLLAQLEEQKGNTDGARQAYEDLANVPDVPKDLKQTSELLVAQLLVRGNRHADAETRLMALKGRMQANDPQLPLVTVYLVQTQMAQNKLDNVEKQLRGVLLSTGDGNLKASGHNALGDYYRLKNQNEDAFWQYLRVDVMYAQDKNEHARALYWLWKLFDKTKNDPVRAEECYNKLADKEYAGTEYQTRALAEKKPPTAP
jgi:hypothetical protein